MRHHWQEGVNEVSLESLHRMQRRCLLNIYVLKLILQKVQLSLRILSRRAGLCNLLRLSVC